MVERIAETITQFGSRVFPELFPNTRGPLERRSTPENPPEPEASAAGTAEEAEDQPLAILLKGPERIKGLPFLLPNVLDAYSGLYRWFLTGEGESAIRSAAAVYYTEEEIVPSDSWNSFSCGDYNLLLLGPNNVERLNALRRNDVPEVSEIIYYSGGGDWSLFFAVMPLNGVEGEESVSCGFIVPFLRGFVRFLTITGDSGPPPFPAVLED